MGGSIDMNVGVFWETVGFLKSVILHLFPNVAKAMLIWMSKVDQNSEALEKK